MTMLLVLSTCIVLSVQAEHGHDGSAGVALGISATGKAIVRHDASAAGQEVDAAGAHSASNHPSRTSFTEDLPHPLLTQTGAEPVRDVTVVLPAPDLIKVYEHNQITRNAVKAWVTPADLNKSVGNYGLGPPVADLAKDVGKDPIQHDFISQLGARLESTGETVNYLEIGVSVLKGIHTQSSFFRNAFVTAFDIEDPNPTIETKWNHKSVVDSWDASSWRKQNKREHDYINKYDGPNNNTLYYIAGDAYSGETYDHFAKTIVAKHGPMNLILSDAYHTGDSVTTEIKDLLAYGVIDPTKGITIVWDDCDDSWDGIYTAMKGIFSHLRTSFSEQATCSGRFTIPGWVGKNEGTHGTCIFSTMDLSGPSLGSSGSWIAQNNDVTCQSRPGLYDYALLVQRTCGGITLIILALVALAMGGSKWLVSGKVEEK